MPVCRGDGKGSSQPREKPSALHGSWPVRLPPPASFRTSGRNRRSTRNESLRNNSPRLVRQITRHNIQGLIAIHARLRNGNLFRPIRKAFLGSRLLGSQKWSGLRNALFARQVRTEPSFSILNPVCERARTPPAGTGESVLFVKTVPVRARSLPVVLYQSPRSSPLLCHPAQSRKYLAH